MADLINKTDSLNQGREKLNKSIKDSETALNTANDADQKSDTALSNSRSTQDQLDTIIVESGTSDAEVLQARTDKYGQTQPTLKERIDLQEYYVNIKSFGAVGDGVTDDSQSFIDAHADALANNATIWFPEGTYNLVSVSGINLASMEGQNVVILVSGNVAWNYDRTIKMKGISFESDYFTDNLTSHGTFINPLNDVDEISLENVKYKSNVSVTDGTERGKLFMRIQARKVLINNFETDNIRQSVIVQNTTTNDVTSVTVNDFHVVNGRTGLQINGGDPNVSSSEWIQNVSIQNISLTNTQTQSTNYDQLNGGDALLCSRIRHLSVQNIQSEYPVERAAYINVVDGLRVNGVTLIESEGVKAVGFVDKTAGITNYAKDVNINNVDIRGGNSKRGVIAYEVRGISIDGINAFNPTTSPSNSAVLLERTIEDCTISNIKGQNSLRGIVHFNTLSSSTYDNYFKNVTIKNINFKNPTNTGTSYHALRFQIDPNLTETYLFENIKIENVYSDNWYIGGAESSTKPFVYESSSNNAGLIDIDKVNGLTINNSVAVGINDINGGISVGVNSQNVDIDTKLYAFNAEWIPNNINASANSSFKVIRIDSSKSSLWENHVIPVFSNVDDVVSLLNRCKGELSGHTTLTTDQSDSLPFNATRSKSGYIELVSDNGEYMTAHVTPTGVTKINGSTNTGTTNASGTISVHLAGDVLVVRNRMASTVRLDVKLKYLNEV